MKKRLLAIGMTMIMAISFTACTTNQPSNPTKATEEIKSTEETKPTEETKSTEEAKPTEETKSTEETTTQTETNPGNQEVSTDVTGKLADAITKALGDNNGFDVEVPSDELFTVGLAELDQSKVNAIIAMQNAVSAVNPDTLVIVDCEDGYTETVLEYLKQNYDSQKSYQELYPFAVEKVNGTRLYQQDNLLIYVIAGGYTPEENVEAFVNAEYEKVDEAIKSVLGALPENLAE